MAFIKKNTVMRLSPDRRQELEWIKDLFHKYNTMTFDKEEASSLKKVLQLLDPTLGQHFCLVDGRCLLKRSLDDTEYVAVPKGRMVKMDGDNFLCCTSATVYHIHLDHGLFETSLAYPQTALLMSNASIHPDSRKRVRAAEALVVMKRSRPLLC